MNLTKKKVNHFPHIRNFKIQGKSFSYSSHKKFKTQASCRTTTLLNNTQVD